MMIFKSWDHGKNIAQQQADTHTENVHAFFCIKNNFFNFAKRKHPTHLNMFLVTEFTSLYVKHVAFWMFCQNVSVKVDLKSNHLSNSRFSCFPLLEFHCHVLAPPSFHFSLQRNVTVFLLFLPAQCPASWSPKLASIGVSWTVRRYSAGWMGWVVNVVFVIRINLIGWWSLCLCSN